MRSVLGLLAALILTVAATAQQQRQTLTPAQAIEHIGETATVCGTVASAAFAARSRGQPTFLNLDKLALCFDTAGSTKTAAPQVSMGPIVWDGEDGHYHAKGCPRAARSQYTSFLKDAIRRGWTPCPVCKPEEREEVAKYETKYRAAVLAELADEAAAGKAEKERRDAELAAAKAAALERTAREAKAAEEHAARMIAPLTPISAARVRQLAADAAKAADNDPRSFEALFEARIASVIGEYKRFTLVGLTEGLTIAVVGPISKYENYVSEQVRKFEPVVSTYWDEGITIMVSPSRIDAPDIEKVIVQRNGMQATPIKSDLLPRPMVTRMGAKDIIHSGSVTFPASVFAPGKDVTVKIIAIPASGPNIVEVLTSEELRAIR